MVAIYAHREKEGKAPMSVELYRRVCRWFVDWGTLDGIFAHTFTILSWNLACRANNTAKIRLKDVEWASTFDAYEIFFAHTKTDQTGEEAKYSRHVYANPMEPLVCPVLTLAFYFSCCLNVRPTADEFLFPGNDQYQRYSKQLYRVLHEHVDEVRLLGFEVADIGTHSIRKGAISYLASLPGGPPIAAVCIRAGWTMGNVRDIYMRYISSGDQFVGRCLSMLPLLRTEFGSSPPLFVPAIRDWADDYRKMQFSMLTGIAHLSRMTLFCFASLAYHRAFITTNLGPNHVVRTSGPFFRDGNALTHVGTGTTIVVSYPWSSSEAFTGIPPHVAILQDLTCLRTAQEGLIESFVGKVKQAIDECGLSGGALTEHRLRDIFEGFSNEMREQFQQVTNGNGNDAANVPERIETGDGYRWHFYRGSFHRVPEDWRFPRVGVSDMWNKWWIGDTVRGIPPLRMLTPQDIKFLDDIPLTEEEVHGRTGCHKYKRRPSRKTYSDLAFLMNYITRKVQQAGRLVDQITPTSVSNMFETVADEFSGGRNSQKKWNTVAHDLRKATRNVANETAMQAMHV